MREPDALIPYIDARMRMPFAWGDRANDCASFADGGCRAQGCGSIIHELGVSWTTGLGAARVLKRLGGLQAAMDLRRLRVARAKALRGDIGLVEGAHGPLLVLIEGDTVAGPGPYGVQRFPRQALIAAWDIERPRRA